MSENETVEEPREGWPHECPVKDFVKAVPYGDTCQYCGQGPEDENFSNHQTGGVQG